MLTGPQKQEFYERGFIVVPGVVPRIMIDAALRAINNSVGEGISKEDIATTRSQSYAKELAQAPVIVDLLNKTPAWALAESLIGPGKISPVTGGQIALRFPSLNDPPRTLGGHLDGMYTPFNGVPEGTIQNFTVLAVILLSDLPNAYSGNFTVWPGSHHLFEKYFREHGPDSLLSGMPPMETGDPVQITGRAGDVVLCHYQVKHTAGPNASPHVRYASIYRLYHVDHGSCRKEAMTDIWLEWDGMRETVAENVVEAKGPRDEARERQLPAAGVPKYRRM